MADIFVSYARPDRALVEPFVAMLEAQGWSVWWDRSIGPGSSFSKVIEQEIAAAKCLIVLWSTHSIHSDWVNAEASEGFARKILIPVKLEEVSEPLIFRQTQASNLVGWPNTASQVELEELMSAIAAVIEKPVAATLPQQKSTIASRAPLIATVLLLAISLTAVWFFSFNEVEKTPPGVATLATVPPVPSSISDETASTVITLNVMSFDGVEPDISVEVMETIARASNIQILASEYEGGTTPDRATYTVRGLARNNVLSVSLFDNDTQRSRSMITIDLKSQPLHETIREIARGVIREFRSELSIKSSIIPDDLFLQYLDLKVQFSRSPSVEDRVKIATQLNELLKTTPRFAEGMAELCRNYLNIYSLTGDAEVFSQAEQMCNRASRLDDKNPWTNLAMGSLYRTAGQLDEAAASYEKTLDTSRYITGALTGLARVSAAQGDIIQATRLLKEAQSYEPNNWAMYEALAAIYFERGMFDDAAAEYKNAIALSQNNSFLLNDLGSAYFMQEKFDLAIENWEKSNAIQPNYAALSNLGSAYYYEGKFDDAVSAYQKAIAISDQDYRMWMNAGEAAFHSEQIDSGPYYAKAIELALPQWEINPDELEVRSAIALSYASIGNTQATNDHIEVIEAAKEVDIYTLYDLAVAYSRLGKQAEVSRTLERLITQGYPKSLVSKDANFN